jgi:hypothetical protein
VNISGQRTGQTARGIGDNSGVDGHWRATEWEVGGYSTYGPYDWAMRRISWQAVGDISHPGELRDNYFHDYMNRLSRIKLSYMFGSQSEQYVHEPNWIVDYTDATKIGLTQPARVARTMFYLIEIASSVTQGDPRWLTPGTFRTSAKDPIAIWARGWVNTEDANRWRIQKVGKCLWKDSYSYETTQDVQLGIQLKRDAAGQPVWRPVYMAAWYVWVGIDVGGTIPVSNPCNWDKAERPTAPMLLDANATPRLGGPIHNASSWDLWTPDWKAGPARTALGQDLVPATQPATTSAPTPAEEAMTKEIRDVLDPLLGTK